jgi:hypothetical protein
VPEGVGSGRRNRPRFITAHIILTSLG